MRAKLDLDEITLGRFAVDELPAEVLDTIEITNEHFRAAQTLF